MDTWSFVTVVVFTAFVAICVLTMLPTSDNKRPYQDAEKLALKDEDSDLITPRHPTSDKRTES